MPLAKIHAVATFYKAFSLIPKGKHTLRVCLGTACHIRGAKQLVDEVDRLVRRQAGETSEDMKLLPRDRQLRRGMRHGARVHRRREVPRQGQDRPAREDPEAGRRRRIRTVRIESFEQFAAKVQRSLASKAREDQERRAGVLRTRLPGQRSGEILEAFRKELDGTGSSRRRSSPGSRARDATGCARPARLVILEPQGLFYTKVKPKRVAQDRQRRASSATRSSSDLLYKEPGNGKTYKTRGDPVLQEPGPRLDAKPGKDRSRQDIDDAIAHGAYGGLVKALSGMSPDEVLTAVERIGAARQGRGRVRDRPEVALVQERARTTASSSCATVTRATPARSRTGAIMEGDPHSVLEGMILGAYAIGASEGLHLRARGVPARRRASHLERAIEEARERGFLGENILGTGFSYDVRIARGGGAFVCGESSALMKSVAGEVGEPRAKYVHSVIRGRPARPARRCSTMSRRGPTSAWILDGGGRVRVRFGIGTKKSTGTKCVLAWSGR